jgi:feruloyl esterase
MKRKGYTVEKIIAILKEHDAAVGVHSRNLADAITIIARRACLLFALLTVGLSSAPGAAQESGSSGADSCNALQGVDFSRIPDAPTQITETTWVAPESSELGYCEVNGYVTPQIEFLLRLPAQRWNGKFIEIGCGGPCGVLTHITQCDDPLRRGYACIVSDGGHKSTGSLDPMRWAFDNPRAPIEYFVRASHVTALAGKAIAERYYGYLPSKSYFMGCSAGGIQAMWAAQKFPWDFDGIIAGGPALHLAGIWMNWVWANRALTDEKGEALLGQGDLDLLHQNVVAHCDMNEGIEDGVIGDPRNCPFSPSDLRCDNGKTDHCLTAAQVEAVERVYSGPTTSKGEQIELPIAMRGSERTWRVFFGSPAANNPGYNYIKDWYGYSVFPLDLGSVWQPSNFDFDRDYERLGAMEALEPNNADLSRFEQAGGKLLMFTGWNDSIEGVLNTVNYYETAEKVMGGRVTTQEFLRLFVVPGMNHCAGGEGASTIDWLSYLEAWVEKDQAPDSIIGAHIRSKDLKLETEDGRREYQQRLKFPLDPTYVDFYRPVYPYPAEAKYLGRGDPTDASSFGAVPERAK